MIIQFKPNGLSFKDNHFIFKNKLTYVMVDLLYKKSLIGENLTFCELENKIKEVKPLLSLQRMQVSRMVSEIEKMILSLSLPINLHYYPRCKTVGPWYLIQKENITVVKSESDLFHHLNSNHLFSNIEAKHHPKLLRCFLFQWVDSFSSFDLGFIDKALLELKPCYQLPISLFTIHFLNLYKSRLLILKGEYQRAEKLLLDIVHCKLISECNHLVSNAKIMLIRIKYECLPLTNFSSLITEDYKPQKYYQEDAISLMEWNNLQSLLLRRKLRLSKNKEQQQKLHFTVIHHFEEAIIISIMLENRNRFLDFCLNYVLHLQSIIELDLCDIQEVLNWYQLIHKISSKLSIGDYSIWDTIFYTQFYLKYKDKIILDSGSYLKPDSEDFYINILKKAKYCSNNRQIVLFYLSYFEFAFQNLPKIKLVNIAHQIISILEKDRELYLELMKGEYSEQLKEVYEYQL